MRKLNLLLAIIFVAAMLAATPALGQTQAVTQDFDIPGGHFFTQTNGQPVGASQAGYSVTNNDGIPFWTEFGRQGGLQIVGYPMSRRFQWDGFTTQVFQKAVFQWKPVEQRVDFVNVFDEMAKAGKNDWLLNSKSTPMPLDGATFDAGKSWDQIVAARVALLNANPAMRTVYNSVPDPMRLFGLPTSAVVDNGNHYAIRLQRAVIQQWKEAVPWAAAGQVTVGNGGDIAVQAGMFSGDVLAPEYPPGVTPPATPTATATPKPAVEFSKSGDVRYQQNEGTQWIEGRILNADGSPRNGVKVRVVGKDGYEIISRPTGSEWRADPNGVYAVTLQSGQSNFIDYEWYVEVWEDDGRRVTSERVTVFTDKDPWGTTRRQVALVDFKRN
ncbi:MAG: hypothetical protein ACYC4L_07615 [Chloroflexota bacterium]